LIRPIFASRLFWPNASTIYTTDYEDYFHGYAGVCCNFPKDSSGEWLRHRRLNADLQIVVAFRMLPEVIWNMPEHGTYNLHGSLLPQFRGAAPIHWAVMTGAEETGVTSFKLKHEIDTGDLLFQESTRISDEDTTGDVYHRLMHMGADVVLKTV